MRRSPERVGRSFAACKRISDFYATVSDPKYRDHKVLCEAVKAKLEKALRLDGKYEMQKFATCQLEDNPSVSEWVTA
jgi:hypothetical protein